jgi:hypothetical protein
MAKHEAQRGNGRGPDRFTNALKTAKRQKLLSVRLDTRVANSLRPPRHRYRFNSAAA